MTSLGVTSMAESGIRNLGNASQLQNQCLQDLSLNMRMRVSGQRKRYPRVALLRQRALTVPAWTSVEMTSNTMEPSAQRICMPALISSGSFL